MLTQKAWEALAAGHYDDLEIYVRKCMELYEAKAKEMQTSLKDFAPSGKEFDYWALNDVGTCLFIQGRAYYMQGRNKLAKKTFKDIQTNFHYAQCWDLRGWFWKVTEGAEDQVLLMEAGIDFGDYTSETLTVKAWKALDMGDNEAAIVFARKCIYLYTRFADDMQSSLNGFAKKGKEFDYWALNDIGTCYYIMGEAYMQMKEYNKSLEAFKILVERYFYTQCWDPHGWFWKPAITARGKINAEHGLM